MKPNDIAITGMSCIFPGAPDVETYWKNLISGYDAISIPPPSRIDPCYYERDTKSVDRLYCFRGGFIDNFVTFDPIQFGIVPSSVDGTEPDHLLTLKLTHTALEDAGIFQKNIPLGKAGIVIGKGNYLGKGALSLIEIVRTSEQFVKLLEILVPDIGEHELENIKRKFQKQKGKLSPETAMGLIPNLVASIVANRFGLGGPAYTVDAACASSLLAVDHAVRELRSNRCDVMIAGGIHTCHEPSFWTIFNQLGALSREQQIRPFSKKADGILIGEGFGFVVLRRLEDAIRDEQKIYAVIKGVGVSSDGLGGSVLRPLVKGQLKAVQHAWEDANLDCNTIGYLEAHGTATPTGDRVELETLQKAFGIDTSVPHAKFGSVKSMIGHAMPAAGIAGLIKTALALYHGKLPPTLHCEEPMDEVHQTRFDPVQQAMPWNELPRRAGVNAFGFGGINAHVVMDAFDVPVTIPKRKIHIGAIGASDEKVIVMARHSEEMLLQALQSKDFAIGEGNWRIAIFDPTDARIEKAIQVIKRKKPWKGAQDIWFTSQPLLISGGKVAFMFPGSDAVSGQEDISTVTKAFGLPDPKFKKDDDIISTTLVKTETSQIISKVLTTLGVVPDCMAGHSAGEWNACLAAGMVDIDSVTNLHKRVLESVVKMPDVLFLSVGCSAGDVREILEQLPRIYISNDNCPHQVILCGTASDIEKCRALLNKKGVLNHVLPFRSGFHTPFVNAVMTEAEAAINSLIFKKATIPVWSATTTEKYPNNITDIKKLQKAHLLNTVRFRELIQNLFEKENVKVFVQIGEGALTGFIDDTLKGKEFLSLATCVTKRPVINQLHRTLAALFVEGKQVDLSSLPLAEKKRKSLPINLELGLPFALNFEPLPETVQHTAAPLSALLTEQVSHPVVHAFNESLSSLNQMQQEIVQVLAQQFHSPKHTKTPPASAPSRPTRFTERYEVNLDKYPTLRDHGIARQRENWTIEDTMPVVPFTMTLELLAEMALRRAPGKVVRSVREFRVHQWIKVHEPFSEIVQFEWKDDNTLYCEMQNYFTAEIILADRLSDPPDVFVEDIGAPREFPLTKEIIYKEFLFHGPAYQGIESVDQMGDKGLRGTIAIPEGKGALLDNAGQIVGLWLNVMLPVNHVAFPVKIDEVCFYDDFTIQQGQMECSFWLKELTDEFTISDIEVRQNGRIWATLKGWRNRRFEMDDRFWKACMAPLSYKLAYELAPGVFLFNNAYRRVSTWEFVLYRFFNKSERQEYESRPLAKRKSWLISRVALKDAVRALVERKYQHSLYPAEITVKSEATGRPIIEGVMADGINVSLAHKNDFGVAFAAFQKPAGIDLEEIKTRSNDFCSIAFHEDELKLFRKQQWDEDVTRAWVAKEAYGKSLGIGLQGNPKRFTITEMTEDSILIEGTTVKTIIYKNHIIGWTL